MKKILKTLYVICTARDNHRIMEGNGRGNVLKFYLCYVQSHLSDFPLHSLTLIEVVGTGDQMKRIVTLNKMTDFSVGTVPDILRTQLNKTM